MIGYPFSYCLLPIEYPPKRALKSSFYFLFGRNPHLPTESTLTQPRSVYNLDDHKTALVSNPGSAWEAAKASIPSAQTNRNSTVTKSLNKHLSMLEIAYLCTCQIK